MKFKKSAQHSALIVATILIASCSGPAVQPSVSQEAAPARGEPDTTNAEAYKVDGAASTLHVLVYRGGAMARLGHNHVLSTQSVTGTVLLSREFQKSHVDLTVPVASFVVDDAKARSAEGEDFAADVPADAREGTRRNLLREEVLDAEHFPVITMRSIAIAGARASPQITMRVSLKGSARDIVVPVTLKEEGARITATGQFELKQSDFGMKPFSVALGALQVQDQLKIRFSLVCRK
jgi:polyisoprenoid-binding protein YceI